MSRFTIFTGLALLVINATLAPAAGRDEHPLLSRGDSGVFINAPTGDLARSGRDTVYLMGAPGSFDGRFETADGDPEWHGWYSVDATTRSTQYWHADTYNAENLGGAGNHAAWCGAPYPACGPEDVDGGYGDLWNEQLNFRTGAPDLDLPTLVTVNYDANFDTEPGHDFVELRHERSDGGYEVVFSMDGDHQSLLDQTIHFSVQAVDYIGEDSDQIHLQWRVTSDVTQSDQDCVWPTRGACQIDNLQVLLNGNEVAFDDFEDGPYPDEIVGNWTLSYPTGVGNYGRLWTQLDDLDPCFSNYSCQVAFIDHQEVIEGSDGQQCITWCYGPGGYIVNTQGGFAGPDFHLLNALYSPPLQWADQNLDGAIFSWSIYQHETLAPVVSPGMFDFWGVRSITAEVATPEEAQTLLNFQDWKNYGFVHCGGPAYKSRERIVTDLLQRGRSWVQLQLGVYELGWIWSYVGDDGYPAPYFDNVSFAIFPWQGPIITAAELGMANDAFPEIGSIDYANPAANSCRFDMAYNIVPPGDPRFDSGDSIVFGVTAGPAAAELNGPPRLYFKILWNQIFGASARTGNAWGYVGDFIEGCLEGYPARWGDNPPAPNLWAFDLPDSGLLFPGDVLHYYIRAEDILAEGIGVATFPADTSGFSDYSLLSIYNINNANYPRCAINCLPSLNSLTPGDHPPILFWNRSGSRGGQNKWYYALLNNGLTDDDFDLYYTNAPASGLSGGLGNRATATQMVGYMTLLYTSGNLNTNTLVNDLVDSDLALLNTWLGSGDKNAFFTGDDLAYDLSTGGPASGAFLSTWLGVQHETRSVRSFIANQTTPTVRALTGNPVWFSLEEWIAYGSCPLINEFDGVTPLGNTESCAEFLDASGQGGVYEYSAGTYHHDVASNDQIIFLPYDFMYIYTPQGADYDVPGISARALVLRDVLLKFGQIPGPVIGVPEVGVFMAKNYPNPFNPKTTIEFTLPQRGHVTLKIFNLRGELVRTLVNELRPADSYTAVWDGTDERGGRVSSGVYFYELKANGESRIAKMALVK